VLRVRGVEAAQQFLFVGHGRFLSLMIGAARGLLGAQVDSKRLTVSFVDSDRALGMLPKNTIFILAKGQ
jgi:hypothetical protein